jgi:hypothetical protein
MGKTPEQRVEEFAGQLEASLLDNLQSLLLFGSAADGQYVPGRSDINLLLVVGDGRVAALRPAAAAIAGWVRHGEPAPLVFSGEEWVASADVFPLEIEDMRGAHRLIRGRNPLPDVTTSRDHLRHQLEREVRGALLRLRTQYAAAAPDSGATAELLETSFRTFLVLFRATLRVAGREPPAARDVLVRDVAQTAGLDPAAFAWPLASRAGRAPRLAPFDPAGARYLDEIEKLAHFVNRL